MSLALVSDLNDSGAVVKRRPTVLIVEDREATALAWKGALEPDYEVEIATTPEVAIRAVGTDEPEILILDLDLEHQLDGLDVAERTIERFPLKSLIVVSAKQSEAYRRKARQAGLEIAAWLDKPPDWDELTRVLARESKKHDIYRAFDRALETEVDVRHTAGILTSFDPGSRELVEEARLVWSRRGVGGEELRPAASEELAALYERLRGLYTEEEDRPGVAEEIEETLAEIRRRQSIEAEAMSIYFAKRRQFPPGQGLTLLRQARERLRES